MPRYQKKWNNQGGSDRGSKYRKPKKDLPSVPEFDKLPESNTISFRIGKQKPSRPNYRQNGDEIWTDWDLIEDNGSEIGDYELPDLELPNLIDDVRDIPNTISPTIPPDIVPFRSYPEYELNVKFGNLVVTITSGQAHAARNQINESRFDFAIVVTSSDPIIINGNNSPKHVISVNNPLVDPIFSVYEWLRTKLGLATDNSGQNNEPLFANLVELIAGSNPPQLPPTSFIWQSQQYDLFYGVGIPPKQICLHAIDEVVKFTPSVNNPTFFWTVTSVNEVLPLCIGVDDVLPLVWIVIPDGSPTSIDLDDVNNTSSSPVFTFRIFRDSIGTDPLTVFFTVNGSADSSFYIVGNPLVSASDVSATIPAGFTFVDLQIKPLPNENQLGDKTIVPTLSPSSSYDLDNPISETVNLTSTLPIVTIGLAPGSPNSLDGTQNNNQPLTFRISINKVRSTRFLVKFAFGGTAPNSRYTYTNLTVNNSFIISAESLFVDIPVFITADAAQSQDLTIILNILPDPTKYTINNNSQTVVLTAIASAIAIRRISLFANDPSRPDLSGVGGLSIYGSNVQRVPILAKDAQNNPPTSNNRYPITGSASNPPIIKGSTSIDPFREYLIDIDTSPFSVPGISFLSIYGARDNYHTIFYNANSNGVADTASDIFVSKKIIKDFLTTRSLRYLTIELNSELYFDFTETENVNEPIPRPARNFSDPNVFKPLSLAICQAPMPVILPSNNNLFTFSPNAPASLSTYPSNTIRQYASNSNAKPRQVDIINTQKSQSQNSTPYTTSVRVVWYQFAIEFDTLADPDLISPRIIPVVYDSYTGAFKSLNTGGTAIQFAQATSFVSNIAIPTFQNLS